MKQIDTAVCVMAIIFALVGGCIQGSTRAEEAEEEAEQAHRLQVKANDIVVGIQYIMDPRTNLCFAYYWEGSYHGGPALATVPCDVIPSKLLTTANPSNR